MVPPEFRVCAALLHPLTGMNRPGYAAFAFTRNAQGRPSAPLHRDLHRPSPLCDPLSAYSCPSQRRMDFTTGRIFCQYKFLQGFMAPLSNAGVRTAAGQVNPDCALPSALRIYPQARPGPRKAVSRSRLKTQRRNKSDSPACPQGGSGSQDSGTPHGCRAPQGR